MRNSISNSGVSMISLVVAIVIMMILASIAMTSGIDSVSEANKTKVETEINELKKAVSSRMIEVEMNPSLGFPGTKVEDITEYIYYIEDLTNEEVEDAILSVDNDTIQYFRIVDSTAAAMLGVNAVEEDHYFIVDYYSGKVYGSINMSEYNKANGI